MTGDSVGAGNVPPVPRAILEPTPGMSEAEYRLGVEWVEALIARYRALADALAKLRTATGPSVIKKFATVLALVQFLAPDIPPANLALFFDLLPPLAVKLHSNVMRGAIAVAVAVLRSTNMGNSQIEQWLDEEIRRRALDFTAHDATRWFYECSNVKASVPSGTLEMFRAFRPEPSLSLTEAAAKKLVAPILDAAVAMKAGPLTRPRRRG